jgi:putative SbcD/Mre11-related phosphoesterase
MKGYRLDNDIELLPGGAVVVREPRAVVVADLHLGAEAALEHDGLSLPRLQTKKAEAYLRTVVEEVEPDQLVIAGDLKHNFSRNLIQEWDDVDGFVRAVADVVRLVVVKGNHDNYLSLILRESGVPLKKEHALGAITVIHGHANTDARGRVIMGHIHPSVTLKDGAGARVKRPCYLFDRKRGTLIIPALSIVSPGIDVVGNTSSDNMSPALPATGLTDFTPLVFSDSKPLIFPTVGELRSHDG